MTGGLGLAVASAVHLAANPSLRRPNCYLALWSLCESLEYSDDQKSRLSRSGRQMPRRLQPAPGLRPSPAFLAPELVGGMVGAGSISRSIYFPLMLSDLQRRQHGMWRAS